MHLRTTMTALAVVSLSAIAACGGNSSSSSSQAANGGGNASSFCQQSQQIETTFTALGQSLTSNAGSTPDVASFQQLLKQGAQALDNLDSQAPSEIATAFHHLRTAFDQVALQAQSVTSVDQLASPLAALNDSSLQADQTTVNNYMKNTCHITPQASTAPSPT